MDEFDQDAVHRATLAVMRAVSYGIDSPPRTEKEARGLLFSRMEAWCALETLRNISGPDVVQVMLDDIREELRKGSVDAEEAEDHFKALQNLLDGMDDLAEQAKRLIVP
jgi:hypothetical protein